MSEVFDRVVTMPSALREGFIAAYEFAQKLMGDGERVHITIKEALDPIRARQRKFLKDIVFQQIAEQVFVGKKRERFTKEIWAEHFRRNLLGDRYVMRKLPGAAKATPHRERNSTEELGVKGYSLYTDKVIDLAIVEHGVEFQFTREERDGVRYIAPRGRSGVTND